MTIEDIISCCAKGEITWSNHAVIRAIERQIDRDDIIFALKNGKIIEEYPTDYPFPSCLVSGLTPGGQTVHIVVAINDIELRIITVYRPNLTDWSENFTMRRQ
jgi:hypothetical protein